MPLNMAICGVNFSDSPVRLASAVNDYSYADAKSYPVIVTLGLKRGLTVIVLHFRGCHPAVAFMVVRAAVISALERCGELATWVSIRAMRLAVIVSVLKIVHERAR
jgi:hypothetical protein